MAKVVLSDGKEVEISSVLFNKEQNINVSKTYITTVKKAVTKVSEDFYKVDEVKKEESNPIFETVSAEVAAPKVEQAVPTVEESPSSLTEDKVEEQVQAPVVEEPVPETPVLPEVEPILPEVTPTVEPKAEVLPAESELPRVEEPKIEPVTEAIPTPTVEPILPVSNPVPVVPESELPEVSPAAEVKSETVDSVPEVAPLIAPEPVPTAIPPVMEQPVEPELPKPIEAPVIEPVQEEQKLFFDGSEEINLNRALDEVSSEKTMPTQEGGVASLREFGVDGPAEPVLAASEPVESTGKVLTKSKGFANNKFFMVVAIIFFVGACVFLGYEAFHYFELIK